MCTYELIFPSYCYVYSIFSQPCNQNQTYRKESQLQMSNSQNLRYTLSPFARTEYDNDNIGQDQIFSRFSCQFIGFHNRTNGDQSCTNLFE